MTERWRSTFNDLRAARRSVGLCERCNAPSRPGRVQCAECAAKHNVKAKARYVAAIGVKPAERRCGSCGVVGHSRRRCAVLDEVG